MHATKTAVDPCCQANEFRYLSHNWATDDTTPGRVHTPVGLQVASLGQLLTRPRQSLVSVTRGAPREVRLAVVSMTGKATNFRLFDL